MNVIVKAACDIGGWRSTCTTKFNALPKARQSAILWSITLAVVAIVSIANPDPAYAQNLESFASKVRGLLCSPSAPLRQICGIEQRRVLVSSQ